MRADQAGEPNVGLSYDESRRLGTKPVRAICVETGRTREPGRDRPVLLLRNAAIAAGGRDQAVLFDGGRRRGGEQTRERRRLLFHGSERYERPVEQTGYDYGEVHVSPLAGARRV